MTHLASSTTFASSDYPKLAAAEGSSASPAYLAAEAALEAQGWVILDSKGKKALGYTWHKVTATAPFFHGAWIHEVGDKVILVIVDRKALVGALTCGA